jgi:alkylation response protein AidB-like acyl-CoA dehydrogenase
MLERIPPAESRAGDCIARTRSLAPLIAAHAARAEAEREIAPEVLAALYEARLFRMLLPKSCDGLEVDPASFMQAVEELAKADGSTAWCVVQGCGCSMAAAYLEPAVAREIFGDARAVLAWGPVGPNVKAVAVAGGYRATGSWSFASGIKHATWLGGHSPVLEPDGSARLAPDGKPAERTVLFPKASARVNDIWRVVGLKATGSDNYVVEDLFVPDRYSFTRESAADRRERGPLYRFTTFHLYGIGFAAIALGLARASLDAFVALAATKVPKTKTFVLRDNAVVQSQVALAEAKLSSARAYLLDVLREAWDTAARGEALSLPQRAAIAHGDPAGAGAVRQFRDGGAGAARPAEPVEIDLRLPRRTLGATFSPCE